MQLPPLLLLCWLVASPLLTLPQNKIGVLRSPLLHCAISVILATLLRWPGVTSPLWLNFDEANIIAEALRAQTHPIPWTGFDTSSSGPLNAFVLLPAGMCTGDITLMDARATGLTCSLLAWVFAYMATRRWLGDFAARVGMAAPLLFLATTTHPEFVHFSSEQFPLLLLSASWLCLSYASTAHTESSRIWLCMASIAIASLVPFTKLQGAPLAVAQASFALCIAVAPAGLRRARTLALCLVAGLTPPLCMLAPTMAVGGLPDFWNQYIAFNLTYSSTALQGSDSSTPAHSLLSLILYGGDDFMRLLVCAGALALGTLLAGLWARTPSRPRGLPLLWIAVLVPITLLCVLAPNKPFAHYLLFGLLTLGLLTALCAHQATSLFKEKPRLAPPALAVLLALCLWPMAATHVHSSYPIAPRAPKVNNTKAPERIAEVLEALKTSPSDSLAIWGFAPEVFVITQLRPATPMLIGQPNFTCAIQPWYIRRFTNSLKEERPTFFLDCVAPGMPYVGSFIKDRHEASAELKALIEADYTLVWSQALDEGSAPLRLYRRRR